jgi:hypothetical protein
MFIILLMMIVIYRIVIQAQNSRFAYKWHHHIKYEYMNTTYLYTCTKITTSPQQQQISPDI